MIGPDIDKRPTPRRPAPVAPSGPRPMDRADGNTLSVRLDSGFRIVTLHGGLLAGTGTNPQRWIGEAFWALPFDPMDSSGWSALRSALERGESIRNLLLRWFAADGLTRFLSLDASADTAGGYTARASDVSPFVRGERAARIETAVARIIARAPTFHEATPDLLRAFGEHADSACTVCWDLDPSGSLLTPQHLWTEPGAAPFGARLRQAAPLKIRPGGPLARLIASGRPGWLPSPAEEASLDCLGGYRHTMRSAVFLPVLAGAEAVALFACFSRRRANAEPPLLQALERIGAELGEFFERSRGNGQLVRFRAAMDQSGDQIFLVDRDSMRFVDVNQTAVDVSGYSRRELLRMGPHHLIDAPRDDLEAIYDQIIAAGDAGITHEVVGRNKRGKATYVEVHRRAMQIDGRWLIVSVSRDVFARRRAEMAERRLRRMFAALSATNDAILRVRSAAALYRQVCNAAVEGGGFLSAAILLPGEGSGESVVAASAGRHADTLPGLGLSLHQSPGTGLASLAFQSGAEVVSDDFLRDPRVADWHPVAERAGVGSAAAFPLKRAGRPFGVLLLLAGERRTFDDEIVALVQRLVDNVTFALESFEREAERRLAEERIQYLATHDPLTGLPNRTMFTQTLTRAVERADRAGGSFAVLFIDLDRFKAINDSFGHAAGDLLLQEMAARLGGQMRAGDVVARLGGDEFVVLLDSIRQPSQVGPIASKMLSAVLQPVNILGHECRVTTSIGVALFPRDGADAQALMKNADLAMYAAKKDGKNGYRLFSAELEALSLERLLLETHLRAALENGELHLEYQAQIDAASDRICGVEALLRWDNPELGAVTPAQFIPAAEETGLIVAIGRWVLETACAQSMAWQHAGLPPVCLAVNLSARQFAAPDILEHVAAALAHSGLAPDLLELEITEGMVMRDPSHAVQQLEALKAMGVRIAIDDFGTGYSSLGQIKSFPVDTIKVDRSFIRDIPGPGHGADCAITEAIIAMAHTLSLTVIAEGVENSEQVSYLRAHACDEMQGFYFSRPVTADEFAELLRARSS